MGQIYKKVVERKRHEDGEEVTLECGHRILLIRHRLESFECEQCMKAASKNEEATGTDDDHVSDPVVKAIRKLLHIGDREGI